MYYPQLRRLGKYEINPVAINLLDSWLAIQRQAVLKNLSPLSFSLQSDVDMELAIDMFSLSSIPQIGVLKPIYKTICPYCDSNNGSFSSLDDVPSSPITCKHCEHEYIPRQREDLIEIVFERCYEPEEPLSSENAKKILSVSSGGNRGNGCSLRVSDITKHPSNARRHLISKLDSRYEAAQ